jgi:nucleoside-diphosphate-sugar epimerase
MKRCDHRRSSLIVDAARAPVLALEWPAGPINVVDDEPASGTEWLASYASVLGAPPPPVRQTRERWERGISNAKARQHLGWQPLFATSRRGFQIVLSAREAPAAPGRSINRLVNQPLRKETPC